MEKNIINNGHSLLLPRADEIIGQTIARLWTVKFETDPLMSMNESFMVSIWDSAKKRDGAVIEAAIMDAIEQTPSLRLLPVATIGKRRVDILFEVRETGHIVALEIKRGSLQDSKAIRQFRVDLLEMPDVIQRSLPLSSIIRFHIVFISGTPPISEGLKVSDLKKLYKLDVDLHIDKARRKFSDQVRKVIQERAG
jgi:hypothetical protein